MVWDTNIMAVSLASSSSETQGQIVGARESLNRQKIWHKEK